MTFTIGAGISSLAMSFGCAGVAAGLLVTGLLVGTAAVLLLADVRGAS